MNTPPILVSHFSRRWSYLSLCVLLCVGRAGLLAQSAGRNDVVAITGQTTPASVVGSGPFASFDAPFLNSAGQVAFKATFTSGGTISGVYLGTSAAVTNIAIQGTSAARGGTYSNFNDPTINSAGQVAFSASTTGGSGGGLYLGTSSGVNAIALIGDTSPAGGTFSGFTFSSNSSPWLLNDTGRVEFISGANLISGTTSGLNTTVQGGSAAPTGGTYTVIQQPGLNDAGQAPFVANISSGSYFGLFLGSSAGVTKIATTKDTAPGGGTFSNFAQATLPSAAINSTGAVAFYAQTSGGTAPGSGIYLANGSTVGSVALAGAAAPGGGVFSGFNYPAVNNSGNVAFFATTTGAPGSGVYVTTPGGLKSIALQSAVAPGGGTFSAFSTNPSSGVVLGFNNAGDVAFTDFNGTTNCLYIGDGTQLFEIAGNGVALAGSTVSSVSLLAASSGSQESGQSVINDFGQVAYKASLNNGKSGVFIYTPVLHWRSATGGNWSSNANWTLGVGPASVHDVIIDPATSLAVSGPAANTTVQSLQVGGGAGTATLDLQASVTLTVSQGLSVVAGGQLFGNGTIVGNLSNAGLLSPGDSTGVIQVSGNLLLGGSGTLKMEIGGLVAGSGYDSLVVGGNLSLSGTLDIELTGGFTPTAGESFHLFTPGSESGAFASVQLPALDAGLSWDTTQLASTGTLVVAPEPSAVALLGGAGLLILARRRLRGTRLPAARA